MARRLNEVGIIDTPVTRDVMMKYFSQAVNDTSSIVSQEGSRITREFFVPGPSISGVKIVSSHEGDKQIAMFVNPGSLFG